jgi:uncharacterized protein YggE
MNRRIFISGLLLAVIGLLIGVGATLLSSPTPAAAQTEDADVRTIQVSGRGRVSAQPDQAIVRLGVETEANTAEAALEENNEQMTAVISATIEAEIAEDDIQTQGFNLRPVYESPDEGQLELTGYRASNIVQITVRDLSQLGTLLDAVVSAGSNSIEGIQFEISNQADLEAAAREAAMENAQEKAEQLTSLAGGQLGPVQMILETGGFSPIPVQVAQEEVLESGTVPIQPGTQTIEAAVQVTWQIQ